MKCRKCRKIIFLENEVKEFVNAHGESLSSNSNNPNECESIRDQPNVYLNTYTLPSWLLAQIEAEEWKKGKIYCPNCQNKIGAFDHISGHKCSCSKNKLAPVYFIKSKVDLTVIL